MNTSFNGMLRNSIPYAFIVLIAYIISTAIFIYLPKSGVDFVEESSSNLEYKKYDGFYSKINTVKKAEVKQSTKRVKIETLSKYSLKGIYSTASNGGWVIIENKSKSKTHILSQYEELNGYILTKLYKNFVIFEKAAKEYKLEIKSKNKNVKYEVQRVVNNVSENVVVDDNNVTIKRNYLNSYVNDIDKVWKNIAINETRENGKITGFKVNRVNDKSVFGKLGLKKGDVIKAINNNVLSSYADAFKVYNNISDTKYLNIEILRNNEIMELNYEID